MHKARQKVRIRYFWFVCALFGIVLFGLLILEAPKTSVYNATLLTLLRHYHPAPAYYLNFDDAQLALLVGNYYFGNGGYDLNKAEASYSKAYTLDPTIHLAHYQLARLYFVEGGLFKATDEINKELALDPYNERSFYVRGLIDIYQGDLAQAESDFRTFTLWGVGEWGGYNDLSYVLAKEGKYAQSEAVLNSAFAHVHDAKSVPWLWNSLGLAQLNQHEYKDAVTSFSKAQGLASTLTTDEWHQAYSANDPSSYGDSIVAFQSAIEANLKTAQAGLKP